jgi:hypothetical protein
VPFLLVGVDDAVSMRARKPGGIIDRNTGKKLAES